MLKALRTFVASVVDPLGLIHSVSFRKASIIAEPRLEAALLELNCPVAPVDDKVMVACQKCGEVFNQVQHTCDATVTLTDAAIPYGTQFFTYKAKDIIPHFWWIEALEAAHVPLDTIQAVKCPKCQHIFH